jgi:hypothetical protein
MLHAAVRLLSSLLLFNTASYCAVGMMQCMTSYIAHFKTGSLGLQDSVISAAVGAAEEAGGGGGGAAAV